MASLAFVASYFSLKARRLFIRDVMCKVLGIALAAFLLVAGAFTVDGIVSLMGFDIGDPFLFVAGGTATVIIIAALIVLIRWAEATTESKSA